MKRLFLEKMNIISNKNVLQLESLINFNFSIHKAFHRIIRPEIIEIQIQILQGNWIITRNLVSECLYFYEIFEEFLIFRDKTQVSVDMEFSSIDSDNNHAQHAARTPCGSRVRTRMQQSCAHSSKGVRGISVRRTES